MNDLCPLRIFVIDDDPFFVELIEEVLKAEGHSVSSNISAVYSLSEIRRKSPNCVLVDLQMAEMDGLELCQELRKMNELRATKIIFVSSHSDELWKERSAEAGADGYITKPIDATTLVQTIESIVRRGES